MAEFLGPQHSSGTPEGSSRLLASDQLSSAFCGYLSEPVNGRGALSLASVNIASQVKMNKLKNKSKSDKSATSTEAFFYF